MGVRLAPATAPARRYGVPRKFVEYVLPLAPYYPGWLGLAHLLSALFNEHLARSDARA